MLERDTSFLSNDQKLCAQYLQTIVDSFGQDWLADKAGRKRVQLVWNRWDPNATIELLTLGQAIKKMSQIDSAWVKQRIKAIQESDAHGDLFELRCCALFASGGMDIRPAKENQPGFDATVILPSKKKLFVSMKNHDISRNEIDFRDQSKTLRELARELVSQNASSSKIMIMGDRLLKSSDWQSLAESIREQAANKIEKPIGVVVSEGVLLMMDRLPPMTELGEFADDRFSDVFVCACKEFKDEQNRFKQFIDDARFNMRDKIQQEPDSAYVVFMRLHPTASLNDMEQYAREQLDQNPEPGCDGFIFYQPAFTRDRNMRTTLVHHIKIVAAKPLTFGKDKIKLETIIGLISQSAPRYELHINNSKIDIKNHYIYQASDQYYKPRWVPDGDKHKIELECKNMAAGMFAHRVIDETTMPPALAASLDQVIQMPHIKIENGVMSGNFAPDDEILLI
jgi:hypothetical protein